MVFIERHERKANELPRSGPQILVERHKKRTDSNLPDGKFNPHDPETIIADVIQKHEGNITEENIGDIVAAFTER